MASNKPRYCMVLGCSFVTRSNSGICAACALVDPRLLLLEDTDLVRARSGPGHSGKWAMRQNGLEAALPVEVAPMAPMVPESVCARPAGSGERAAGILARVESAWFAVTPVVQVAGVVLALAVFAAVMVVFGGAK